MQAEAARLEQLQLSVISDCFATELELGRHAEVIPDLVRLVALHPHQEKLRGQLMTALWRSGQREEALMTYLTAYRLMVSELGIEPSKQLQLLYRAILSDEAEVTVIDEIAGEFRSTRNVGVSRG
jgi:DNA-binding SARP family transcriptional activator